jgi:hypothetical protein
MGPCLTRCGSDRHVLTRQGDRSGPGPPHHPGTRRGQDSARTDNRPRLLWPNGDADCDPSENDTAHPSGLRPERAADLRPATPHGIQFLSAHSRR